MDSVRLASLAHVRMPVRSPGMVASRSRSAPGVSRSPPAGLPPFMQAILMRALTKDADQRYQYASDMANDLRAAQSGLPDSEAPPPVTTPSTTN